MLKGSKLSQIDISKEKFRKKHGKAIRYLMDDRDPHASAKSCGFPKYIIDTFKSFADHKRKIVIHLTALRDDYPFMKKHILSDKCKNLVLFDRLGSIFPNCVSIEVWSDLKVCWVGCLMIYNDKLDSL